MNFVELKSITTKIGSGSTPRGGGASYKKTGISLIRSMNVQDLNFDYKDLAFIDEEQADRLTNVIVSSSDILLNITGASVARCCLVPDNILPARVNQHVAIIRLNQTKAVPEYVNYCLNSPTYKRALLSIANGGATREALTKSMIESFKIPCPDVQTQQKIASILSAYDDLIENNKRRIQILEEMAQRIYREWFVHFRFPGHENVKMVDSELGKIPEGWEVKSLLSLMDIQGGTQPPASTFTDTPSTDTIRLIQIRDFQNERHLTFIPNSNKWRKCLEDDILIARYGASLGRILRGLDGAYNVALAKVIPSQGMQEFLYYFLLSPYFQESLIRRGGRTAQSGFNKGDLTSILVVSPPSGIQKLFGSQTLPMWHQKKTLLKQGTQLHKTRDLLLPRLISGRLDVEDLEIAG